MSHNPLEIHKSCEHEGLCRPLSDICYITGRWKKGKGLEVLCIIMDPRKTQRLFEMQHLFCCSTAFPSN